MFDDAFASVASLSRKLQAREVSAEELARFYLQRIDEHKNVNAFLDVRPEETARDHSFAGAAAVLTLGIFVLGIFYHPITDLIEAGVRLI